jgi:hypothetical protein
MTPAQANFRIGFLRQGMPLDLAPVHPWPIPVKGNNAGFTIKGTDDFRYIFNTLGKLHDVTYDKDWDWPWMEFDISALPSGVYVVAVYPVDQKSGRPTTALGKAIESGGAVRATPPSNLQSMAVFVKTPAATSGNSIAYILPVATYHAYNFAGGASFYQCRKSGVEGEDFVTMRRPGGGAGYFDTACEPGDGYDPFSPRQTFAHWDAPFIGWLQYEFDGGIDFFADTDLDNPANPLLWEDGRLRYQLMVSAGHHEYWSQHMWDNVAAFLRANGNVATFSGNTCFRPVEFEYDAPGSAPSRIHKLAASWPEYKGHEREDTLLGTTYSNGGGKWGTWDDKKKVWKDTARADIGYTIPAGMKDHWVFEGTKIAAGQTNILGGGDNFLIGYECDGRQLGSTVDYAQLGTAALPDGWDSFGAKTASMGIFNPFLNEDDLRGKVFHGGTTDWPRVLYGAEPNDDIRWITWTVIRTLSHRLTSAPHPRDC